MNLLRFVTLFLLLLLPLLRGEQFFLPGIDLIRTVPEILLDAFGGDRPHVGNGGEC